MLWNFRGDFAKIKKNPVKKNDDETKKWTMPVRGNVSSHGDVTVSWKILLN